MSSGREKKLPPFNWEFHRHTAQPKKNPLNNHFFFRNPSKGNGGEKNWSAYVASALSYLIECILQLS